jgi:hypothetical protein
MTVELVNLVASDDQENRMEENTDANVLPDGFSPSEMDVICGWARQNFHHGEFIECHLSLIFEIVSQLSRRLR